MTNLFSSHVALRRFTYFLCFMTISLIFLGGLVKSTESGLSVPDWPTTYGQFMFSFPLDQMVGGIKYEHTHRMLASIVGLLTLGLTIWLLRTTLPVWIKRLGIVAFLTVVIQGILGGLTVKFFLPIWLSSLHGVLAQTFLMILIFLSFILSVERRNTQLCPSGALHPGFLKASMVLAGLIFVQLIIANVMRHAEAGLAIPDFPSMGGSLIPSMDVTMLNKINAWRFDNNLDPVTMGQVHLHLLHRLWALLITGQLIWLNHMAYKHYLNYLPVMKSIYWLNICLLVQVMLGISTVLSQKEVYTTTAHVTLGAITLGLSLLLILRAAPLTWGEFKHALRNT